MWLHRQIETEVFGPCPKSIADVRRECVLASFLSERETPETLKVQKLNFRSNLVNLQEIVSNIYVVSWTTSGNYLDSAFSVSGKKKIIYIAIPRPDSIKLQDMIMFIIVFIMKTFF